MIIILARCSNGYCGCESEDVFFFDEGTLEREIDEDILTWARENAESYASVHFDWDEHYTDEEYDDYIENYVDFDWHKASYEEYVEWCENLGYEPREEE